MKFEYALNKTIEAWKTGTKLIKCLHGSIDVSSCQIGIESAS